MSARARLATAERLESRRLLSAGDLDLSFGSGGVLAFDPAGPRVSSVSVLSDGRFLAIANNADPNLPYLLRRYTSAGQLDTTFGGGDGQVEFGVVSNLPPGYFNTGASISPLSDGKLLVRAAITQNLGPDEDPIPTPYLERLNSDGTVDPTFGDGGVVKLLNSTFLNSMVIQGDGKILILCTNAPTSESPILLRYNSDGSVDTSFGGGDGKTFFPASSDAYPTQLLSLPDGKILGIGYLALTQASNIFVQRLNGDGTLDTSFAHQGQATADTPGVAEEYPAGSVLLRNGKLRIGVSYERGGPGGLMVLGINADGTLDTSFGDNGISVAGYGFAPQRGEFSDPPTSGLSADAQGRLLVFGSANTNADVPTNGQLAVARLDPTTGRIDESFGRVLLGDGHTIAFVPQQFALQSDGAVIVLARAVDPAAQPIPPRTELPLQMRRLLPAGSDPSPVTLSSGGTLSITGGAGDDYILGKNGDTTGGAAPTIAASVDGFGRVFDTADVSLVSVLGSAGNDVVDLSRIALPSTVSGGDGDDRIAGGDGRDSLSGNAGKDQIAGGNGNDRLAGNGGRDPLKGDYGDDRLFGGSSADKLYGDYGDDQLWGEGGNDRLSGGVGADQLHGGAGYDTFLTALDQSVDRIWGDGGRDCAVCDTNDLWGSIEILMPQ